MQLTILSLDPGLRNHGYAVVQMRRASTNRVQARVLVNGVVPTTVTQLKSTKLLRQELSTYLSFMGDLIAHHNVDVVGAERYMSRGGQQGPNSECINVMLGALISNLKVPYKLIGAATWKNAVRRAGLDLKAHYKWVKTTPHQFDSVLIGLYVGAMAMQQKDFGDLRIAKIWEPLSFQVEDTSTYPLTNRVLRRQ